MNDQSLKELTKNLTDAYDATKDDRAQVVVALAVDATRVRALAESGLLSPDLSAILFEHRRFMGGVQIVACYRDGLDRLFAAANDTPVDVQVEAMIDSVETAGWPVLVVVDDRGIGLHIMRRGEVPCWDQAIISVSWPERVRDRPAS